jgi:ActR/RegA family two-component response regulator
VAILIVCSDEERLDRLKEAIHSAGFTLITAKSANDGWSKTDYFDFAAVVIDRSFTNDIAASAFGQRFITLRLGEETTPRKSRWS